MTKYAPITQAPHTQTDAQKVLVQVLIMSLVVFIVSLESEEPSAWRRELATLLSEPRYSMLAEPLRIFQAWRFRFALEDFFSFASHCPKPVT